MKRIILILICCLVTVIMSSGQEQQAQKLLGEAIYDEEVNGNLAEAIKTYQIVLKQFPDDRKVAAEAMFHLGMCYEKQGTREAMKTYRNLVNTYPDQKELVAQAKERLNRLVALAEKELNTPLTPKFTKIEIPTNLSGDAKLSPDGQELALVSDKKLWKVPLSGNLGQDFAGTPVQVNTNGTLVENSGLSWSNNSKWIAFNEYPETMDSITKQWICIVPANGGKPTKIIKNFRAERYENYSINLSPDAGTIAYSSVEKGEQYAFQTLINGGSPIQMADIQSREPAFSPNGKWIAYVEDKKLGYGGGNLWIVPSTGGTSKLIAKAEYATSPVWSPDNSMIAFVDYAKKNKIEIVEVHDKGKGKGNLISINIPEGYQGVTPLAGWTSDNKIGVVLKSEKERALYSLPVEGGVATVVLKDCWAMQPRYSPDGRRIYYTTPKVDGSQPQQVMHLTLASVQADGGTGKLLAQDLKKESINQIGNGGGNRISPDGKTIISAAWEEFYPDIRFPSLHLWKISTNGLEAKKITNKKGHFRESCPCWSPNGDKIAFMRTHMISRTGRSDTTNIIIIDSSGNEEKTLVSIPDKFVSSLVWSPDGKMLAYLSFDKVSKAKELNLIDAKTGTKKFVWEVPSFGAKIDLAWSPDSKQIAFNDSEGRAIKIMNVSDGNIEDIETNLGDVKIYHLDWSPDGKKFVFAGEKEGENDFWFMEDFLPLEKLAQKQDANTTPSKLTNKKIWDEQDTELDGAPSPDGKYISYVDWETGDLALYEIATGNKRRITNKGSWDKSDEFALMSRWSPDGKQIVYEWNNGNRNCDLRIIGLEGQNPRILYSRKDVNWIHPYDWSSDGKQILAYAEKTDGKSWTTQIILISVNDGSVRILKSSNGNWPENMCFSPDGQYVLYDWTQKEDSPERDIFMMSTDGSSEIPLVKHPAHDELLCCTQDGKNILFASDRNGTYSLWSKQIIEGKPHGNAKLVESDIGAIEPLGFTSEGSFYYGYSRKNNTMYNAELDPETGTILSQPRKIITRFEGYNQTPSYSPDGKNIAYVSKRFPLTIFPDYTIGQLGGNVLCIKSLETGKEREFFPNLEKFINPRWSPDGRSVIIMEVYKSGSNKIDVQTGNVSPVLYDKNIGPQPTEWSPDGKTIYYVRRDREANFYQILVRHVGSGTEKEIFRIDGTLHIRLSPDGKWLAVQSCFIGGNLESKEKMPQLFILPSTGGEPRVLCRFEDGIDIRAGAPFTWTPDGKYILYAMKSPKKEVKKWDMYRVPAKGGEPEKLELEMGGFITNLSIHPDGRQIAFSVTEESNAEIWEMQNFLPKEETAKK